MVAKINIKRLERLEEATRPPRIETLADLVIWCADPNRDEDVEFSPEMWEMFQKGAEEGRRRREAMAQKTGGN